MSIAVWSSTGVRLYEKKSDAFSDRYYLEYDSDWPIYDFWESPNEDLNELEEQYIAYADKREEEYKKMRQDSDAKLVGKVLVTSGGGGWSAAERVFDEAKKQPLLDKWTRVLGAERVRWEDA